MFVLLHFLFIHVQKKMEKKQQISFLYLCTFLYQNNLHLGVFKNEKKNKSLRKKKRLEFKAKTCVFFFNQLGAICESFALNSVTLMGHITQINSINYPQNVSFCILMLKAPLFDTSLVSRVLNRGPLFVYSEFSWIILRNARISSDITVWKTYTLNFSEIVRCPLIKF